VEWEEVLEEETSLAMVTLTSRLARKHEGMQRAIVALVCFGLAVLLFSGCAIYDYSRIDRTYTESIAPNSVLNAISIDPQIEEKILAMDPDRVTGRDVREVLHHAPAPRIFNIHGGIYPVFLMMIDFSEYLIGMGYPEDRIRHPRTGAYTYSCYESSVELAGLVAWHYEREALRPMIIGHSQGGIQAVKVLYQLAGEFNDKIPVYNPITDEQEARHSILDPLTGEERSVVGLKTSFIGALGAGGWGRIIPNQWIMNGRLRTIPDTVVEFTGYYIAGDFFGGDFLGIGDANLYHPNGKAEVRNVALPFGVEHITAPGTKHLLDDQPIRDWINDGYVPSEHPTLDREFDSSTRNILWAADVWHRIKKHWVLELQRLIRAKRVSTGRNQTQSVSDDTLTKRSQRAPD